MTCYVFLPHSSTISVLIVNIFIVVTYYHYISYFFTLDNFLRQLSVVIEPETYV